MNENETFLKDHYNSLCRFCLAQSSSQKYFDELAQNESYENQFGLQLSSKDELPKVVCFDCHQRLAGFLEFHEKCLKTVSILKSLYLDIKIEKADSDGNDHTFKNSLEEIEKTSKCQKRKTCQCYICGKIVKRLHAHLLFHSQDRKYFCDYCGKGFVFKGNLCQHISTHLAKDTKEFSCGFSSCNKSFTTSVSLRKHTKVHSGKNNFRCHICSRGFNRAGTLKMHILQIHEKNPTHSCLLCEKKYYSSTHLKNHIRTHVEVPKPRPKCEKCEKTFKSDKYLEIHLYALHQEEKKTCVCQICCRTFSRPSALINHMKTHKKKKGVQEH